jgi:hypothetical protein
MSHFTREHGVPGVTSSQISVRRQASGMVYSSVSQTVFTRGPLLLASKNISMHPHIFARVNIVCSDDRYMKFKAYISELILDS